MSDVDDQQIECIKALMKKHASAMVQLTYRRTCDWHLAEDLVQETFLTACCKSDKICNHEKPAAWLFETLNKLTMREMGKFIQIGSDITLRTFFPKHLITSCFIYPLRLWFCDTVIKFFKTRTLARSYFAPSIHGIYV